ncbi:MAG: hypothetical protein ACTSRK_20160 [Promethearchaeota archaeon]
MLAIGDKIQENIELYDQDGSILKIDDFKGRRTVYYTYPTNSRNMSLLMSLFQY